MFSKLREVLLTQYIGAILTALLVFQGAAEVISQVARTAFWFFYQQNRRVSVFERQSSSHYAWENFILSMVIAALDLLTAYSLAKWLYPLKASNDAPVEECGPPTGGPMEA